MRQLKAFMEKIRIRTVTEEYYHRNFFAQLHRAEMPSLDSILGVASEDEETPFDERSDKELEARALALLEERKKAASVGRSLNKN